MSYDVHIRGGDIFTVSDDRGKRLLAALDSPAGSKMIELDGHYIKLGLIDRIEPKASTEADYSRPALPARAIRCHGQYSVQKEINAVARRYDGWSRRIQGRQWRNRRRAELLMQDRPWCDYQTDICNCEHIGCTCPTAILRA